MSTADLSLPDEIALRIPPRAEYLVFCRLVLSGIARAREIDQEVLGDLKLAVTEACSNSIRHAYRDGAAGDVDLRYEVGSDYIAVEVVDGGRGFEVAPAGPPASEDPPEAGMGLAIIRAVVDDLELGTAPGGHGSRVRFTKYLS
jgi:serine/threonine-protein kinase RsbW